MFEKSHNCISSLTRNDHIKVCFRSHDTHGFACAYLFWKYFKTHDMLGKVEFIAVQHADQIEVKEEDVVFLIDIDLTPMGVFFICRHSKSVTVIDYKTSVIKTLVEHYQKGKGVPHNNLRFLHSEGFAPIAIVWKTLDEVSPAPKFVTDLHASYCFEFSQLPSENKTFILRNCKKEFEVWDAILSDTTYEEANHQGFLAFNHILAAAEIAKRTKIESKFKKYNVVVANCNREFMDEVGIMMSESYDICILHEMDRTGIYHRAYVNNSKDIDLLSVLKAYKVHGFEKRAWFTTEPHQPMFKPNVGFFKSLFNWF